MYRSRLFTVVAFAGVMGFGTAALSQCSPGIQPGTLPTTTTTTTTTTIPLPPLPDPLQEMISVAPDGSPASFAGAPFGGESSLPSMSADGRYVAFQSDATNLVPGDTNGTSDVFVRDRVTQTTQRIPAGAAGAGLPRISANGRYVAFATTASLVPSDTNGTGDEYLFDRTTGAFDLISVSTAGTGSDGAVNDGSVSDDGRYVVFQSDADDLVSNDVDPPPAAWNTDGMWSDVFLRDRSSGTTTLLSAAPDGSAAKGFTPSITPDGRFVVFGAGGSVIAGGDPSLFTVFVYATGTGALEPENYDAWGNPVTPLVPFSISADGNLVTFMSSAAATPDTPTPSDPQGAVPHIYVRNRAQHTTVLVDVNGPRMTRDREPWNSPANISSDGRYVAYICWCERVYSGGSPRLGAYRTDLATGDVVELDATQAGVQGDDTVIEPGSVGITADGTQVAYASRDSNLVPGDTNNARDIFVATPIL